MILARSDDVVPVSIVIPTVGRTELLATCLASIARCSPRPTEIIVVDQSGDEQVAAVVTALADVGARLLRSSIRDRSLAVNDGVRAAASEIVLVTDDDCTVASSWVARAWSHLADDDSLMLTGRVLPVGPAIAVPSLIGSETPHEYVGVLHDNVLFGCNMACSRARFLAFGGFDERVRLAEDNDFCYRWLRSGQRIRYDPEFRIWHHAWRTPAELEAHYRGYARGQGILYAKHLRQRDFAIVHFLVRDTRRAARGVASRILRGRGEWPDARRALPRGVVTGFIEGWRAYGRGGARARRRVAAPTEGPFR
jgi:GT2 family glycosyltransferase